MISYNPQRDHFDRIAEQRFNWLLPQLLLTHGVLCDLIKVKENKGRDIYGHYSGQRIEDHPITTLLVAGLPVAEHRSTGGGQYGQGYFTSTEMAYADCSTLSAFDTRLDEGDVLRPFETDAQFIVTNVNGLGVDGRIKCFCLASIQSGVRPDQHDYPQKLTIQSE